MRLHGTLHLWLSHLWSWTRVNIVLFLQIEMHLVGDGWGHVDGTDLQVHTVNDHGAMSPTDICARGVRILVQ